MITVPRRHTHPSSGANRPSDVPVTVNFNAEFNLMAVSPRMEWFSKYLIPEYCQGLESSAVYTAPPLVVETHRCCSNWSLPRLPLHLNAQAVIPTFLTLNIYIGIYLPKSLTLTWLRLYKMFEVLPIVRISKVVGLWRILNFHLLRFRLKYWLAKGIPLKKGVQQPLQSKFRTPHPYLRWTIMLLQISLHAWLPPCLLHSDSQ